MRVQIYYTVVQFFGYLLQILSMIFFLYAPFGESVLRFSKRRLLIFLNIGYLLLACLSACYLGRLFGGGASEMTLTSSANLLFSLCLALGSVVYFLSFRKGTKGKLLFYLLVVQYGVFIYVINKIAAKFYLEIAPFGYFTPYSGMTLICYALATLLTFPPLFWLLRRSAVREITYLDHREIKLATGCSIAILVLLIIALMIETKLNMQMQRLGYEIYLSVWMFCFMAGDILAYLIYLGCLVLEKEKKDMESKLKAYEQQYKSMCDSMEQEKRRRHDLRHHFRTMGTLVHGGKTEELQEYIGSYLAELEKAESRKLSENSVLNGVLSYYIIQAEQNGIRVKSDIQVQDSYPFNIMDMTVLLGNAMENAIRACKECPPERRCIHVAIRQLKKSILIKLENDVSEAEDFGRNQRLVKNIRGYGMESIELVTRKYQGSVEAWKEEERFILRVVINDRETEDDR